MIRLRPATQEDEGFLLALNRATMKAYVEATYGEWADEEENRFFRDGLQQVAFSVISWEGRDVGCLALDEKESEIFLFEIQILPAYQHRGIGRTLLDSIIQDSRVKGKRVTLEVLKVNKPAQDFYRKIGFQPTGETPTHLAMERKPEAC